MNPHGIIPMLRSIFVCPAVPGQIGHRRYTGSCGCPAAVKIMLVLAFVCYLANVVMGLAAALGGMRFGVWHHVLYAVVVVTALAACVFAFHPGVLLTVAVLLVFPKARPRTIWHPSLAAIGLLGYLWALA